MSTRRARIKAVTSLPPRRKNDVVAENKSKETAEKTSKSPRTPLNENKSSLIKNVIEPKEHTTLYREIESKSLENIAQHNLVEKLITTEKPPSVCDTNKASTPIVPHTPEKVHSIDNKINSNVFVSPARTPRTTFASPFAPSPNANKSSDAQRPNTPQSDTGTPTAHKISDNNELQISETIVNKVVYNIKSKEDKVRDDYSIPGAQECTDDEAMDGIVPLKPAASVPKHIDVLKNEIISENAEVLFDPIIPLPSPSKVRPKLRPVPRLAPLRRNSVQGTSSESEDENRRSLLNSKDPQAHNVHTLQSLPNRDVSRAAAASPVRKKQPMNKSIGRGDTRLRKAMRQRRENTKREAVTMYDLISYNPTSNPLVLTDDEIIIEEANEKQEAERKAEDKVAAVTAAETPNKSGEAAPVPQVKLGPKGEVILDEQSLVIKQTGSDRKVSSEVHGGARVIGGQYRKQNRRGPNWTAAETVRFYRALHAVGTDFTLMTELFPDRTRKQLKVKFKREEKSNCEQVDKALYGPGQFQFNVEELKEEFEEERSLDARQAELDREWIQREKLAERERLKTAKQRGMRLSRAAKALEITMEPFHPDAVTADDIIALHTQRIQKSKQAARQKPPKLAAVKSKQPAPQKPPKLAARAVVGSTSKPKEDTASNRTNTPSLQAKTPEAINTLQIPTNIETGSLVVLTVNDPASPSKKMLQTYIATGPGKLTPVTLPPSILNHVVGYKNNGTPIGSNVSSPLMSPSSVASIESHNSAPSGVTVLPSATKRQRHSSYIITQL